MKRRNLCSETELIESILKLREHRQLQVSEARRKYLAKRTLEELARLMVERKPTDYESDGRITGSANWRTLRGEMGSKKSHTFELKQPGDYQIQYNPNRDTYQVCRDGTEIDVISGWQSGVYEQKHMYRMVEMDWKIVYLARDEDSYEREGSISWRLSASGGLTLKSLCIRLTSAMFDTGRVDWTVTFDDQKPGVVQLGENPLVIEREFTSVIIKATLSGGTGEIAWQHAQLFRTAFNSKATTFQISATAFKK